MRAVWLAIVLLVGCVTPEAREDAPATNATGEGTPSADADETAPPAMGERAVGRMETFVLHANRTIGVVRDGEAGPEEGTVAEPASGTAFYQSLATPPPLTPFVSYPFSVPFETTGEFDITMSFMATAAAAATLPSASGFPTVGAWFGTLERWTLFIGSAEAPNTLEANKVYTVTMRVPMPKGGFFVRQNEVLAIHPYLNYQASDNSPISWVVGGAQPSGFAMPHSHFNLSAPIATLIADQTGETGPNPGVTGDQNPQPFDLAFKVPPEALYIVMEVSGAPKAGSRIDIDGSILTAGGEVLAAGSSPRERETIVLGPSALAQAGRDLVAHVTSAGSVTGGTFTLKVTAYSPAVLSGSP